MNSILIKDTTREEREQIVNESIGNVSGSCDGCAVGILDMYDDYIEGRRELRDINASFRANYQSGYGEDESRSSCGFIKY